MRKLILVKHSLPEILPAVPAREWQLSDEGLRRCVPLAARLALYQPSVIVASTEPKAAQTAEQVAVPLAIPWKIVPGLHEHDRRAAGFLSAEEFQGRVAAFFERPGELVFGGETAEQALARFAAAVDAALAAHSAETVVVVAHGTVISLFAGARAGVDPYPLWRRLGLPSFIVLSLPDFALTEVVDQVAAA